MSFQRAAHSQWLVIISGDTGAPKKKALQWKHYGTVYQKSCVYVCVCVLARTCVCWAHAVSACVTADLHKLFQTWEEGVLSLWGAILLTEQDINISEYSACLFGENVDL